MSMVVGMLEGNSALIVPDQLRIAREDLALSLDEAAKRLGVPVAQLDRWEKGLEEPSLQHVWQLARLYGRGADYFLKQASRLPDRLNFRVTPVSATRDLPLEVRQVLMRFDELCRAEAELERTLQRGRDVLVEMYTNGRTADDLANSERERLRLRDRPIPDLRGLLTRQGVRVFELPIPGNALAGVSWFHREYGPCVLVNALDKKGRRVFTLAHEYAHLIRSEAPTACDLVLDTTEERFASRFAAVFLMPATRVRSDFLSRVGPPGTLLSDEQLGQLAGRYGVSLEALGRRLEELGLLRQGTTDSRIRDWEKKQRHYRGARKPLWQRQLGERFVSLAFEAHSEGCISLTTLAEYFGQDIRKAVEAIEKAKGEVGGVSTPKTGG